MKQKKKIKKVLIIGSGPIIIGQACEFDYSGTQACKALRSLGYEIVLVNSNPATIMTDPETADVTYIEPLNVDRLEQIIAKERPDALLPNLGGQSGLNLCSELAEAGILEKYDVSVIGVQVDAIERGEDRIEFKKTMDSLGIEMARSQVAYSVEEALAIADELGYPVVLRPAYTMGGAGGGLVYNVDELKTVCARGLQASLVGQVLVEESILGWEELELEVVRDAEGNMITVCFIENIDPLGVHTGDSFCSAPMLTISEEVQKRLQEKSYKIVDSVQVIGGTNVQWAHDPKTDRDIVIEINPRTSRSSALASKATGFPIALVSAMLATGLTLKDIPCGKYGTLDKYVPDGDYVVIKFARWAFEKFKGVEDKLGTQMRAVGEVMSIGKTYKEAFQKAIRSLETGRYGLGHAKDFDSKTKDDLLRMLVTPSSERHFIMYEALRKGATVDEIHALTKVKHWFIEQMLELVQEEEALLANKGSMPADDVLISAKKNGFSDKYLSQILQIKEDDIRKKRMELGLEEAWEPVHVSGTQDKAYYYSTYNAEDKNPVNSDKPKVMILGGGPNRIGQGIEFDYCCVHASLALKELGFETIIVNCNPETVSTDYDTADRLYFEPLTPEDVMNIIEVEKPEGVVVAFGGQTAINLAMFLDQNGINILGTSAESIDMAENRERFDALLEQFGIKRPKGLTVMTLNEALDAAHTLEFPVLLRPSYVIGGQNMTIAYTDEDIKRYMAVILAQNIDNPVLVDKYMLGKELEVDVISDGEDVLIPGILEHIERAGVHSGDSIAVYPPQNTSDKLLEQMVDCAEKLALSLKTRGLINIQYLIYKNELYVIEVNPRASRTVPYISKVSGVPMIELATKVMQGQSLRSLGYGTGLYKPSPYVTVKAPVFSFEKLSDINSLLGPEMKSTGEVLGVGKTLNEALFKGLVASGIDLLQKHGGVFISVDPRDRSELLQLAKKFFDAKLKIYASPENCETISRLGLDAEVIEKNEIIPLLESEKIDYIIYTNSGDPKDIADYMNIHQRAVQLSIACLTSLDTANALANIILSRFNQQNTELVDICNLRTEKQKMKFVKMHGTGDDYIFIDNRNDEISCPESLSITFSDRHTGIGGDGLVLIENSSVADAKMRIFNSDGSEGQIAGNCIRCVAKYLYDNKIVTKKNMSIETKSGIKNLTVHLYGGSVRSVSVDMGKAELSSSAIPVISEYDKVINRPVNLGENEFNITCVSVGNPHCIVFCDRLDNLQLDEIGPMFENADIFPERVNTEFVRIVDDRTIRMRVWERGNGETPACGTGACAAVVAAVENGFCKKGEDITVRVNGGKLTVRYTDEGIALTGNANLVFEGLIEY